MTHKKSPSGSNRRANQKSVNVVADGMNITRLPLAAQGFSAYVPCANCAYFKAVPLDSGRLRRLCLFHGVRVGVYGVPGCEFQAMYKGGDDHVA